MALIDPLPPTIRPPAKAPAFPSLLGSGAVGYFQLAVA
jgi:hypothetical protein